jgi:hypothetical protein
MVMQWLVVAGSQQTILVRNQNAVLIRLIVAKIIPRLASRRSQINAIPT